MLKHILVCLLFITVLGCGTHPYPDFTTWHTDAPDSKNRHFKKVSFSKVLKNPQDYVRGNTNTLLAFEAVVQQVTNSLVLLETNNELVSFTIRTDRVPVYSISKGNKETDIRVNQKYIFRVRMVGIWLGQPGDETQVNIYADFIPTPDYMEVLYPPVLIE